MSLASVQWGEPRASLIFSSSSFSLGLSFPIYLPDEESGAEDELTVQVFLRPSRERVGPALSLDISVSLVDRGLPRAEFALFSSGKTQRRKGRKLLRDDFSPSAQGAQGLLGDVLCPPRIRQKLGLDSRLMFVHVLRFLSQPS